MIPIQYRLDSIAEKEYIVKAIDAIDDAAAYSHKLTSLLTDMKQQGRPVAAKILNQASRFKTDYPDIWCLCEWLVMSYEEISEIEAYLHDLICADLKRINAAIKSNRCKITEIKSYHDLQKRKKKAQNRKKGVYASSVMAGIVSAPVQYDQTYHDFEEFNRFYHNWSKKRINHWIIKKTGLRVCPYCNILYTYNRKKSVTSQLDHFFPKSEYPMLALCFYNLVPSCSACNQIKRDDTREMASPYKDRAFQDLRITWDYSGGAGQDKYEENNSLAILEEMITIRIETAERDEQHNLVGMKITEAYQQHRDYASEIIKKARIYTNPEAQKLICDLGESVGIAPEEIERFYLGNYLDESDLKKRPLSKMTKDFYQEITRAIRRRPF